MPHWHDVTLIPFLSELCGCVQPGLFPSFFPVSEGEAGAACGSSVVQDAVMSLVSTHVDFIGATGNLITVDIKILLSNIRISNLKKKELFEKLLYLISVLSL